MICPNLLECCDPPVFPVEQNNILSLGGLLWLMPCLTTPGDPHACTCAAPADQIAQIQGNFGQIYQVSLLLRGVLEFADYLGGTIISGTGGHMKSGGVSSGDGHNVYDLLVSNPAATYHLNQTDNPAGGYYGSLHVLRYPAVVQMKTGATITLRVSTSDGMQVSNLAALSLFPLPGEPALNPTIIQPYAGQWLELDVTAIQ